MDSVVEIPWKNRGCSDGDSMNDLLINFCKDEPSELFPKIFVLLQCRRYEAPATEVHALARSCCPCTLMLRITTLGHDQTLGVVILKIYTSFLETFLRFSNPKDGKKESLDACRWWMIWLKEMNHLVENKSTRWKSAGSCLSRTHGCGARIQVPVED